jgi:hypothetical protein
MGECSVKKTINILIIMLLLIITGCTKREDIDHNYVYKGENEFWSAEYRVNGTSTFTEKNGKTEYDSNANNVFTITYKKEISQLSAVKHMEILYKSSVAGGKITVNDGEAKEKSYTTKSGGTGGAIENKDEVIKVTINLDGKLETIELKNVN